MNYAEHAPTPRLAPYVRCFWTLQGSPDAEAGADPVVPDGCVEVVLNFADRFRRHRDDGAIEIQPSALIAGQLTHSITIEPEGAIDLLGIRFHPWGAAPFFRIPAGELRDRMFQLDELPVLSNVLRRSGDARDPVARLTLVQQALLEVVSRAKAPHRAAPAAAALVAAGTASIRTVAARLGFTVRAVQHAFQHEVGISPKVLMRLARLQRAVGLARAGSGRTLSEIALDAGYYDHAHLARDCRDIARVTPTVLLGRPAALTEVFLAP